MMVLKVALHWKSLFDQKYSQQSSFDDKTAKIKIQIKLAMPSNPWGIVFNLD
jgi:hypothetical protein